MSYTGTNENHVLIKNLTTNNLNFKTENLPVNLNVDVEQQTKSIIEQLIEKINVLESQYKVQFPSGTILPYGGNSEIVSFDEGGGRALRLLNLLRTFCFALGNQLKKNSTLICTQ